jgi:outer membrane protein TolC
LTTGLRQQQFSVFPGYAAALYFTLPLWDGGMVKSMAASSRAQADGLAAQLQAHDKQQEHAHKRAEQDAGQALASLAIAQELVTLAEKRLADAQESYELGVTGIESIAEARSVLRRAQSEVLLSRVAHADARLRFAPIEGREAAAR